MQIALTLRPNELTQLLALAKAQVPALAAVQSVELAEGHFRTRIDAGPLGKLEVKLTLAVTEAG